MSMTRAQVLKRLDEIGWLFVDEGIVQGDLVTYHERGIAWGLACGVVGAVPDDLFAAALRVVESDLAAAVPDLAAKLEAERVVAADARPRRPRKK